MLGYLEVSSQSVGLQAVILHGTVIGYVLITEIVGDDTAKPGKFVTKSDRKWMRSCSRCVERRREIEIYWWKVLRW
jgi:hypothetical protein